MKSIVWFCFFLLIGLQVFSQEMMVCSHAKLLQNQYAAKPTVASAEEEQYDILYVKLDITLTNENVSISGSVTTKALVVADIMSAYVFELDTLLQVDSVLINGLPLPVTTNGDVRKVVLPATFTKSTHFTAQVFYHGMPKAGNGFFDRSGLNNYLADPWGVRVTYTLSEPYMSHDWWPCKQSLQDKIDSAAIWITVPANTKVGSNGLLKNITAMPNSMQRFEWHTQYPMVYYLISAAVAPYIDYSYKVALPGIADSMLVQNYIYDSPGALDNYKKGLDSTAQMLQYFSKVFGTYPFYKEKYGHCLAPLFGGMEHQTMSTCGNAGPTLVSHELAHQWFGDYVTCATWKDIWLNEGFASYAEYLFYNEFRGKEVAAARMRNLHLQLLLPKNAGGTIYGDDTTSIDRIFDGRLSYNKPSAVIHSLRFVANNDSLFFSLLRRYIQQYANSTATTQQFKVLAEEVLNKNLTIFFSQWIYKEGVPIYSAEWNQVGSAVFLRLIQTTSHPQSVAVFSTPIEVKLSFTNGDTTIRLENDKQIQDYRFSINKQITGVTIDPDNWILNEDKGAIQNITLGINELTSNGVTVFPNPAANYWMVLGLPQDADMVLTDLSGRILMNEPTLTNTGKVIYTNGLASGMYILHIKKGKDKIASRKLIKL